MLQELNPLLQLLKEEKHSDAYYKLIQDLRDTDINLEKYKFPRKNNYNKKESEIPILPSTQRNEESGEYGTVFKSQIALDNFISEYWNNLPSDKRTARINKINSIENGDIFYAPQQNTDKQEWKIRPHIVYSIDYPNTQIRVKDNPSRIYAVPLDGVHFGKHKDDRYSTFLPRYIDEEIKSKRNIPNISDEDKHNLKVDFYADTGVFWHNIIEGRELYTVDISEILKVSGHATNKVMKTISDRKDELIDIRRSIQQGISSIIKQITRTRKDTKLWGDLYYQFQLKYDLPDIELYNIIKNLETDIDTFKYIDNWYSNWKFKGNKKFIK